MHNIVHPMNVTISDPTQPVSLALDNSIVVPGGRILEAWFRGANSSYLLQLAEEAMIYRSEKRHQFVVTRTPLEGDEILAEVDHVTIVLRVAPIAMRPCFRPEQGIMARFEGFDPTPRTMMALLAVAKRQGYAPATWKGRRGDFVRAGMEGTFLAYMGVPFEQDVHQLVRAKVITGRPGGLTVKLLSDPNYHRFTNKSNDGTMLISDQLHRPFQGTMVTPSPLGLPVYQKGIARPPLKLGKFTEDNALNTDASFGQHVTGHEHVLHVLSHLGHTKASLNLQAVLFTAKDPAAVIRQDTEYLRELDPMSLLNPAEQRKVRAGVPMAMFMDDLAPWRMASQLHCEGIRAYVYGSTLVGRGQVAFLPRSWKTLQKLGFQKGDRITLHRDPALPNASAMHDYEIVGMAKWAPVRAYGGTGIVIHPQDSGWRDAGGDFDGDAAVAFRRKFELHQQQWAGPSLKKETADPLIRGNIGGTIVATLIDGLASTLGPTIVAGLRLAERGYMDDGLRIWLSSLAQGCVSAPKHSIDTDRGRKMYGATRTLMDLIEPPEGYLYDRIREVRQSSGYAAKQERWKKLIAELKDQPDLFNTLPVQKALRERLLALDGFFEMTGWIRRDNAVLPKHVRNAAVVALMEEVGADKAGKMAGSVQRWAKKWLELRRQTLEVVDDMEDSEEDAEARVRGAELNDQLVRYRTLLRWSMKQGKVHPYAIIAYAPNLVAATIPPVEAFESLSARVTQVITGIRKVFIHDETVQLLDPDEIIPPTMSVGELKPWLFDSYKERDAPLLALDDDVLVTVTLLRDCPKSQQVSVALP